MRKKKQLTLSGKYISVPDIHIVFDEVNNKLSVKYWTISENYPVDDNNKLIIKTIDLSPILYDMMEEIEQVLEKDNGSNGINI